MQRMLIPVAVLAVTSLGLPQQPSPLPPEKPAVAMVPTAAPGPAPAWFGVRSMPIDKAGARLPGSGPCLDELAFGPPAAEAVAAGARTFKVHFDAAGASFVPFLGADAERNLPVQFRLEAVHAGAAPFPFQGDVIPTRAGDLVVFERGGLREQYRLAAGGMEQQFVFGRLPARGELCVRIAVTTELGAEPAAAGLQFGCRRGGVRYGEAVAIDATGARTAVAETFADGCIELRVPAAFVENAVLPLCIDPVVSTFVADGSSESLLQPDIAYDVTADRFLVVWERAYSSTDHDIFCQLHERNGTYVSGSGAWIDVSTDYWARPRVADNNLYDSMLVVAEKGLPWLNRTVVGRIVPIAMPLQVGSIVTISPNDGLDHSEPVVGGDPILIGPTFWCVVWQRREGEFDWDITFQLVDNAGGLLLAPNQFLANNGGIEVHPSISKSDGDVAVPQTWTVVWEKLGGSTGYDISGARVNWNGGIVTPEFAIDTSLANDHKPVVSTRTDAINGQHYWLVVYTREMTPTDHDLVGQLWSDSTRISPATGVNLSAMIGGGFQGQDQSQPAVDSDGCRFAVSWSELYQASTTDNDVFAATFHILSGAGLGLSEGHVDIATSGRPEDGVQITSVRSSGGPPVGYGLVWQDTDHNGDVLGATYDGMGSTTPSRVPLACGGLGLVSTGSGAIGTAMDFQLQGATGVPFLAVGFAITPIALCPACRLGLDPGSLSPFFGTTLHVQIPPRGELIGLPVSVQGADLGSAGGCPAMFRLSDRIDFTVR